MNRNSDFDQTANLNNYSSGASTPENGRHGAMLKLNDVSVCCGLLRAGSHVKHSHARLKIAFVFAPASGVFSRWASDGAKCEEPLHGRHVYCVAAGSSHAAECGTDAVVLELFPEPEFLADLLPDRVATVVARDQMNGVAHDHVLWLFASTIRLLCNQVGPANVQLLDAMVKALARRLFDFHHECYAPRPGRSLSEDRTQSVIDYIEENITEKLSVATLARVVALSEPHFSKLFRNRTGRPPFEYVRECRLIKAHHMALSGEHLMEEIRLAAGFADGSHLNREFKKFFGYPARLLRNHTLSSKRSEKT